MLPRCLIKFSSLEISALYLNLSNYKWWMAIWMILAIKCTLSWFDLSVNVPKWRQVLCENCHVEVTFRTGRYDFENQFFLGDTGT